MKTRDFSFELPPELIAQFPADRRDDSRLMRLRRATGEYSHHSIRELPDLLPGRGVIVINDSRVRKARLYGTLPSGGRREFLFLRHARVSGDDLPGGESGGETWEVMCRRASRIQPGTDIAMPGDRQATVTGHGAGTLLLHFPEAVGESYFERFGHVPLPPYIRRHDAPDDADRYQTVYAREPGSVAAPTAGLHLTDEMLQRIRNRGTEIAPVTLHVGPGTFLPVRAEGIDDHEMHFEEYEISEETARTVNEALVAGRPVIAVGTTSVRTLEAAFDPDSGRLRAGSGSTDIFIRPGFRFNVVSALLTNFHTPESTLLMLVSAFSSREHILAAYAAAVRERYRFFSYGDAMLLD